MSVRPPSATDRARQALPRAFYRRDVLRVAADALGRRLVWEGPAGRVSGRVVEVEAYGGPEDEASHARPGPTPRNASMFGEAGHAYVYFTYGMHHCLNLVTGAPGRASAVLIRALEPLEGLEAVRENRGHQVPDAGLLRGPGCVTRGFGLTRAHDGLDLTRGPLWLSRERPRRTPWKVTSGPRIGIRRAADRPWRLWLLGHPCVSGARVAAAAEPTPRRVSR